MRRTGHVLMVPVALGACSQILGLTSPHGQPDAGVDGAPAVDFALRITTVAPRVPQNSFASLDVAVAREGFDGAITVDIPSPPAGVTVTPATIAAGSSAGSLTLAGASALTVGSDLTLDVVATGSTIQHDVMVTAVVTLQPGTFDPGFGSDATGRATYVFEIGQDGYFGDAVIAPNGAITAVGAVNSSALPRAVIARVTPLGALDASFGSGGAGFTLATGDAGSSSLALGFQACARQSSGVVVAAGQSPDAFGSDNAAAWTTAFNASGAVDAEFVNAGNLFDNTKLEVNAVALFADASFAVVSTGLGSAAPTVMVADAFGNPSATFNGNGSPLPLPIRFAHFLGIAGASGLVADAAGTGVYVGGGLGSNNGAVLHISETGVVDAAFGGSGAFEVGSAATDLTALAVQADGDLIVAGAPAVVARLTPAGALDASFGSAGVANLGATTFFLIFGVAIQSDGRIIVGGVTTGNVTTVLRLLPDGGLDASYGTAGVTTITQFSLSGLQVAPDGGLIGYGLDLTGEPLSPGLFRLAP